MWRGRPILLLRVVAILGPMLLIYRQDLEIVASDAFNSEVMNYILVIPFFIAYALYRKRRMLQAVMPLKNPKAMRDTELIVGLSLLFTTFILYWQGSYTFYPVEYHLLSMPIFLAGAILLVYNWQTLRNLRFPLAMLLFLEPLPLQVANTIGFQLSALSSVAAYSLLKFIGLPVELTTIKTPIITITTVQGTQLPLAIDIACSGLYSIMGFAAFAAFAAFITRGPSWKRAIMFPTGFPMIYGLNIMRIIIIVWIAYEWGEGAAMQTFHLIGGSVLIFMATFLLLILGDNIGKLRIFTSRVKHESCSLCNDSLIKGESFCSYCGIFLKPQQQNVTVQDVVNMIVVIFISLLIMPIQFPPYALAKGMASIDLNAFSPNDLTNRILPTIAGWDLEFMYRDTKVEQIAEWDAALVYTYKKQGLNEPQPIVFIFIQIMKGRHTWEASLYEWPAEHGRQTATMLEERDVEILDNPRIMGRFLKFVRVGSTVHEAVVYWFEQAQFTANGTLVFRYVSIGLDAYSDDFTITSLVSGVNDVDGIQSILLSMAQRIAEYWQPLKTWTLFNVIIVQWIQYVLILTISPSVIAIAYLFIKQRNDENQNDELYKRLQLSPEKETLKILAQESGKGLTTAKAIEAKHYKVSKDDIEPKSLVEALKEATETGLVEKIIANNEDNPLLIWKSRYKEIM